MNPSDATSPLATLRQLKELLDAGTLTPQEFEALKQKLVFGQDPAAPAPLPILSTVSAEAAPIAPESPPVAGEVPVTIAPLPTSEWPAAAPPLPAEDVYYPGPLNDAAGQRNPLTLVFAIGGALLVLALVLYLALGNRTSDEHLTSTSQTAADSTAAAPEVGPQAQQITLPAAAAPETVRVAPALPPPTVPARFRRDSVVAPVAAPVAPAPVAAPAAAAPAKAVPASPIAAPLATDSATTKSSQP